MNRDIKDLNDIRILVDTFYEHAATDNLLGSIFSKIENSHLNKDALYKYWETVLLTHTSPIEQFPKHIELMFSPQHFVRWLTMFLETIDTLFSGPTAEKAKIIVIGKSEEFQAGLGFIIF